jgi:hypothetical protein
MVIADYTENFCHKRVWDLSQYPKNGFGRGERSSDGALMTLKTNCCNAIYSQAKQRPLDNEDHEHTFLIFIMHVHLMGPRLKR